MHNGMSVARARYGEIGGKEKERAHGSRDDGNDGRPRALGRPGLNRCLTWWTGGRDAVRKQGSVGLAFIARRRQNTTSHARGHSTRSDWAVVRPVCLSPFFARAGAPVD